MRKTGGEDPEVRVITLEAGRRHDMLVLARCRGEGIEILAGVQRTAITLQLTTARRDRSGG